MRSGSAIDIVATSGAGPACGIDRTGIGKAVACPTAAAQHSATPSSTKPTAAPTTTKPVSSRPAVIVLNNSGAAGLAATAVARLTRGGWTASNGGNFSGDILSTVAYYDPNVAGAQSAATALQAQFPAIKRVKARFDGLPQGPIILVLTTDYS